MIVDHITQHADEDWLDLEPQAGELTVVAAPHGQYSEEELRQAYADEQSLLPGCRWVTDAEWGSDQSR